MSSLSIFQNNFKNKNKINQAIGIFLYSNIITTFVYILYKEGIIRGFYYDFLCNKKYLIILFKHNFNSFSYIKKKYKHYCYLKYGLLKRYDNSFNFFFLSTNKGLISNIAAVKLKLGGKVFN